MEDPPSYLLERHGGTAVSKKTPNGAARSAYVDVFPPAFPAGPEDYAEIFGGLATSCSIPVLDLPPSIDGGDDALSGPRSSGFDYADIFGGFDGGDFALSYEELVAASKRPEEKTLSSNERIPKETGFHQQTTAISDLPSEGPNGSHVACLERDQILSDSHSSNDESIQYDMPYHKTSRRVSKVDSVNGKAHVTQSHAFPGSIFVPDACTPSQNIESDNHANMVNNDLRFSRDLNGGKTKGQQEKIFSHISSSGGAKCFEHDMLEDQKHFTDRPLASEDRPTNTTNHSRSSSYQSTSSGDISQPNYTFLTVSDISLQTQPLKVPPPSRPPPKADSKQGPLKTKIPASPKADLDEGNLYKKMLNHQTHHGGDAYKNHVLQEAAKEGSSYCFDVEVDASSAAAASAAAMKEAMEQAQARLKSAKELMERKRDNFQSRKKLGHHDVNCKERKEYIAAEEVRSFTEGMTQETILKDDKEVNNITVKEKQEAIKAPMVTPDHEDNETDTASTEKARQTTAQRETRSSQPLSKLEERNGKWKVDKQFYELINNDKEFKIVDDVSLHEGFEKKSIAAVKTNEDKVNDTEAPHDFRTVQEISEHECLSNKLEVLKKANGDAEYESEVAKLAHEHKKNEKLHAVKESCEWGESTGKHGSGVMAASEEVVKEILNAIPDASVQEQNNNELEVPSEFCVPQENGSSLKDAIHFSQQGESEKKLKQEEEHVCAENKSNDAEEAFPCEDEDGESKAFQEPWRTDGVYRCEGEYKKPLAGKCIDCGREVNTKFVTSEPDDYDRTKLGGKSGRQDENNGEVGVSHGSCLYKVEEKMDAPSNASQCEENEKSSIPANVSRYREVNEYKLEGTSETLQQKETKKSNGIQESYESLSHENVMEVALEDLEMEKKEKKLEVALDSAIGDAENEKKLEAAKEACQQHNILNKTREAQMEHQRNGKKQRVVQMTNEEEKFGSRLATDKEEQGPQDIDRIKEVKVASHMVKCNMGSNVGREVCQGVENKNLEAAQQANLLEEKRNITNQALDVTESCIKTENTSADMQKEDRREIEGKNDRKTEQKEELARKLEEEKEREREREKDRIAVQRVTHEAPERALAEAWERAERIAVERVTAEARQRALAEAREKAERASSEASEKSLAQKASREAKLRAERAAVERATAEARERAAEKAAAEARERAERSRQKPTDMQDASNGTQRQSGFVNQAPCSTGKFEGTEGESALRCKARLERHRRTVERAAKALAEKNMRDMLAQREQAERNRLAESLDAEVRRWSNGKEGNLRALLSTLQYILGPDSGWQPIPLTEVITSAAVKKAYRKATLYVHPDKLQQRGASIHQKYICEKVFDLLKDAWNRFNSEER